MSKALKKNRQKEKKDQTLLGEGVTRRMMGLAGLHPIANDFVDKINEVGERYGMGRHDRRDDSRYKRDMYQEEDVSIREMPEDEEELDLGGGDEELPDEAPAPEAGSEELVADLVSAIADAIEDVSGVEVSVEGGEADLGGEPEMDMDMDMGDEGGLDDEGDLEDEEDLGEAPLEEDKGADWVGEDHSLSKSKEEKPKTVETEKSGPKQQAAGRSQGGAGGRTAGAESHNAGRGKLPAPLGLGEGKDLDEDDGVDEGVDLEEDDTQNEAADREAMVAEIAKRVAERLISEAKARKQRKAQQNKTRGLPKRSRKRKVRRQAK